MKIKTKLVIALLALSLPLLIITNFIFYNSERKTVSHNILNHLESVASLQHHRINDITEQYKERLKLVSSRTQLRISLDQFLTSGDAKHQTKMNTILQDAKLSIPDFRNIYIYTPLGEIAASTESSETGKKYLHKEVLIDGLKGDKVDFLYLDSDQNLSLYLAGPLYLNSKLLGMILIDTSTDKMVAAVGDFTGLGQTGETILARKNQGGDTVFTMPTRFDPSAALRLIIPKNNLEIPINLAFSGKNELATNAKDYRNIPVLAATRYIEDLNWGIVVKIDREEAFAPLESMRYLLYTLLTGAIFLTIFISFYLARSITRPISKLTKIAENISGDNFEEKAEESHKNEIGLLAAAFNTMTEKLISTRRLLEKKNTDLLTVNQQLQAGEERYREIYNAPSDAIFIHDADSGNILDVNQGMLEMFGYTYEEALRLDLSIISSRTPPFTDTEATIKINAAVQQGSQRFEWQARKKDDAVFWAEVSLKYIEFSGHRYVIAVVRDINERKKTEQALENEKERLAVTLRSIGDGVITTDTTGNVVLMNRIAEDLTGWGSPEATGRPLDEVFHIVNNQTREICENPITKVISSGQITGLADDTILIAKNGSEKSIGDSGAPILDAKNNIIGGVLVFRDITQTRRMVKEAMKARKLESVGVLAGGIAHDFNNILAAILGNINLALNKLEPHEPIHALLTEAEKASIRAKNLTQQLLTFAKGGEPVRTTTSISEIITDSSSFILRGSNVRCDTSFAPDLMQVDVDPGQISQVIQNIIINATHAMPQGGVIDIRCKNLTEHKKKPSSLRGDKYIMISIKDHGTGIPHTIIDKIFDPYFSTKQEGSGLGLAICHSIIMQHEGDITVSSKPGAGTEFSIFLPQSRTKSSIIPQKEPVRPMHGHGKIMIMDDDEMIRTLAEAMLTHLGYSYELTASGEEAVETYKKGLASGNQCDLIIMDLTIPGGMGGAQAIKAIRALNPDAKVLVSSGYSNDPIMAHYTDYGFCGAITKPYKIEDFNTAIQKVLCR